MTELKEIAVVSGNAVVEEEPQTWRMAIAFRKYQKGDPFLGWVAARLLGSHDVMHCDIIMNCPCGEIRCGCDRGPDDDQCTSKIPGRRCTPCRYRKLESMPRGTSLKQQIRMRNASHNPKGGQRNHVVTYTALETGVMCRMERAFDYHAFFRVHATPVQCNLAEEFLINQTGAKYNFVGSRCNFIPCLPCFRYCCPCGATWDDFDPEVDEHTGQIVRYSDKIDFWYWFCSELATATFCHMGLRGFTPDTRQVGCTEPCTMSPDDLMGYVLKQSKEPILTFSVIDKEDVVRRESKKKL
jgi:hypothetical protein